ncbi:hypothetical protein DITRI_Ditri05aG0156800 [Diplodiscus trichospermus]
MGEEEERKIPVFTVIKNGAILKNIFVINKPPEMQDVDDPHNQESETQEILIVGRHPDCNIMLTHPSISRFHLQILSKPSSQKLYVLDLSSVHGTWVSGKKIDPGVAVELSDGDTIKVGGSTRIYKLHWIPLSRAYDMENPFLSAMDVPLEEEKEGESSEESHQGKITLSTENKCAEGKYALLAEGKEEENSQIFAPAEVEELDSSDAVLEDIVSLFSDKSAGVLVKKEIPSAPPLPKNMNYSIYDDEPESMSNKLKERELLGFQYELSSNISRELDLSVEGVPSESRYQKFGKDNKCILPETVTETTAGGENSERSLRKSELKPDHSENSDPSFVEELDNYSHSATEIAKVTETRRPLQESQQKRNVLRHSAAPHLIESVNSALQEEYVLMNIKSQQVHKENQTPKLLSALNGKKENAVADQQSITMVNLDSTCSDGCKDCLSRKVEDAENQTLSQKDYESQNTSFYSASLPKESVNSSLPSGEAVSEVTEDKKNPTSQSLFASAVLYEDDQQSSILMVNLDSTCSDGCKDHLSGKVEYAENKTLSHKDYESENTSFYSDPLPTESVNSSLPIGENVSEVIDDKRNPTPQSLFAPALPYEDGSLDSSPLRLEKKSNLHSIWSRRGKPASVLQIQTGRSAAKAVEATNNAENKSIPVSLLVSSEEAEEEIFTPDKENFTPNTLLMRASKRKGKNAENKSIPKSLFVNSEEAEEETFTPDKENFTPTTLLMRALKRKCKLEEIEHSSKVTVSPDRQSEDDMIASVKENQTPKLIKDLKSVRQASQNQPKLQQDRMVIKGKEERVPFQSLLVDSACKCLSEASAPEITARSSNSNTFSSKMMKKNIAHPSSNKSVGEGRRTWTMVADTTSLLDKESRKSLQLLQGLKGTRLIIPRMGNYIMSIIISFIIMINNFNSNLPYSFLTNMDNIISVIRELDCLKRRGSLFRRTTDASSVLEWIEDCMVKSKWWIHVQSTMEEGGPIAPTPPTTPQSQFNDGSVGTAFGSARSAPFSARGSIQEIASPTAEDQILDCALLFRKMKGDGQFVLLSNDVTLKIKAMAEGLICETVQEFRESLVNPFSERFMWADSSPRGQTWSVLDDVVLREKYNRCPLRKPSKGDAKGLKLILLHNSHYGQISSVR